VHCTVLVNRTFYVFLGATKTEKCCQIRYSLADVLVSLSPDHGLFDNDEIYSETPSQRFSIAGLQKVGVDNFAS
jgi:3-oxoacyl-ACP reductase-like protein